MTLVDAPDVLTVVECAQLVRTGPKPIYRAIASGELYGRRIGKQIRVPKRAFVAWLEGAENADDTPPELRVLETSGSGRQRHRPE